VIVYDLDLESISVFPAEADPLVQIQQLATRGALDGPESGYVLVIE
jgi:hypothetical protein